MSPVLPPSSPPRRCSVLWLAHAGRLVGFGLVLDLLHVADVHVAGPVGRVPHLVLPFEVPVRAPVLGLVIQLGGNCLPGKGTGEGPDSQAGTEDRKSTRLNSRHSCASRMPSSA